ncbi:MAG: glucose 1-dehydrogenase [Proteobacteria bacterium]|nr:glucose 1-dehydrogenase [Pseudomonadota bacterium]
MPSLDNKVALVTGASRGIGRAIARRLASDGARVVVNYARDAAAAAASVEDIVAAGGQAIAVQADIARRDDIRRLFAAAVRQFGRLDIFVANAGHAVFKPLADITEDDFDRTYAVNARGTFFCLQEALQHLGEGGRIVCISTIGTLLNLPGGACYFGAKAAVEQFCRVAAREVAARGITINAVSPGFIDTDMLREVLSGESDDGAQALIAMTPLARLGAGRDIAGAVSFLVGPDGAWMTRQNLAVDGGIISR